MRRISKRKHEEQLAYQREYYQRNKEVLRQKYLEQKAKMEERKKKIPATELEMYEEWSKDLQNRLETEHLDRWLVTALERQVEQINEEIDKIYEQVSGQVNKKD